MRTLRTVGVLSVSLLCASAALAEDTGRAAETSTNAFKGPGSINDRSPQHRAQMISAFVGVPAWYGYYGGFPFSIGGRFYQPIVHDGFIPEVNDSFGLEFGLDFIGLGAASFGGLIGLPIEAMWQFHLTQKFSAYAKVGVAFEIGFGYWNRGRGPSTDPYFVPNVITAVGVLYKISDSIWLRGEVGYPGIKVGLGFPL